MIKSLSIQNFQSHKKSLLEFDKGVNIIIGQSDCGKTAILRALRLAIWNRPGGEAYRSSWGGDTEVTIVTDEGNEISRAKNKENIYRLNATIFKAFGTDVPKEITEALNVQEVNFQTQFDQPFMLTATAGEVAQHFNRIAHLEQIDYSTKKVQSWVRELEQDIKAEEKQIEKIETELSAYDNLEQLEADLEVLEGMESSILQVYKNIHRLNSLKDQILDTEQDLKGMQGWLDMEADVDSILKDIEKEEEIERTFSGILTLVSKEININNKIVQLNKVIALEGMISPILALYDKVNEANVEKAKIQSALQTISRTEKETEQIAKKLESQQILFENEIGEECPLCGQLIKHEHEK